MLPTTLTLTLPTWIFDLGLPDQLAHLSDRVELVLGLAARNVEHRSGGPFAAAVFEQEAGRLVAVGVNGVVSQNSSLAHAEMLAIGLAQAALGTYDLGDPTLPAYQLVTSSQMCAMCLGAVVWSGVREVVYSTTAGDVTATAGFDEGPNPADYRRQLVSRGISVIPAVMRDKGLAVLRSYVASGVIVYNAHH